MFFSATEKEKLILMLDVQSSVVRGSLVLFRKTAEPHVLFTYNADMPYKETTSSAYLIKTTLQAVSETIQATLQYISVRTHTGEGNSQDTYIIPKKISSVHFCLSSPWIVSQAKVLKLTFAKDTKITQSYIVGLIEQERAKLTESTHDPLRVVEEKIFDVRLNGYSVRSWEGRDTRDLEVAFTASIAGTRMIERFIEECSHIVHANNIVFHSSLLLQYIAMETVFPDRGNYSLIHIHGELTDLAIIRNHSCAFFGSYPSGVRTLIRTLADSAQHDNQAADSLLALYTSGQLDVSHSAESISLIEQSALGWLEELKKLFVQSGLEPVPPLAVILSAWAHDDFYLKMLAHAYPAIPLQILSIDDMSSHIVFAAGTERRRLTALYAIAINTMIYY